MKNQMIDTNLSSTAYGHRFLGEVICLIWVSDEEAEKYYHHVRGGKDTYIELSLIAKDDFPIPDHIYLFTKETIYALLQKDFFWSTNACYFTAYAMKSRYFALDSLHEYDLVHSSLESKHPYLILQRNH